MPLSRILMLFALMLLPVGLVYGMVAPNGNGARAMYVELTCLGCGGLLFVFARWLERRRGV